MEAETDYERYIRTGELLQLQKPAADLICHDELQFQVVHQVMELWIKLILHELGHVKALCAGDQPTLATLALGRVARVQGLLHDQLALLDTMSPREYMNIRLGLGRGSGQESPGFRALLRAPADLWPAFTALLERRGVTLRGLHEAPTKNAELFALAEALLELDQGLQLWRLRHLVLVYRIIGAGTPSLKGKPSDLLAEGAKHRFFPELWDVRDELFAEWTKHAAAAGKQTGYHG
jgi:tryptophan 2,3-dioxygenase